METLVEYFTNIPSAHRSAILVGGISLFWCIESWQPLFKFGYNKWKHAGINVFFTVTSVLINFIMAFLLLNSANWAQAHGIGLLNWLPNLPLIVYTLLGLMLLDLVGAYTVHLVEHKVRWMWMFHLIHHTDQQVDTTSANRHHPGESVFRFVFTTLAVVLVGTPMWLVMLYQSLSVVLSQFNHSNIQLPKSIDAALGVLIVTPNMHHVHHHYVQPYTDCNYGNIFSVWDRLFGTYKKLDPDKINYGIDTYPNPAEADRLGPLLKIPFMPYRPPVGGKFES
jgi:sterol desaturase/sphingolipid hydroxylase (fatty acid hydroxylase superfamily)